MQLEWGKEEVGIRQISNFPIKFLLIPTMRAMLGSISVCKSEADEAGRRAREAREAREARIRNGAPGSYWPGGQGQRPAGLSSPQPASSGRMYKHSAAPY